MSLSFQGMTLGSYGSVHIPSSGDYRYSQFLAVGTGGMETHLAFEAGLRGVQQICADAGRAPGVVHQRVQRAVTAEH